MGQKVNPLGLRVGPTMINGWLSLWYGDLNYKAMLLEDLKIRELIKKSYHTAQVSKVAIERSSSKNITINVYAKRPGIIIGKSGNDIEKLKVAVKTIVKLEDVRINVHEVKKPNIDANIIAQTIAAQLEKRASFRKAMKTSMQACLKQGAKGIKVMCSGRLAGAEIARTEWYLEGKVPLHTLRMDIDYALAEAKTSYGIIGVKVWVNKGEKIIAKKLKKETTT